MSWVPENSLAIGVCDQLESRDWIGATIPVCIADSGKGIPSLVRRSHRSWSASGVRVPMSSFRVESAKHAPDEYTLRRSSLGRRVHTSEATAIRGWIEQSAFAHCWTHDWVGIDGNSSIWWVVITDRRIQSILVISRSPCVPVRLHAPRHGIELR